MNAGFRLLLKKSGTYENRKMVVHYVENGAMCDVNFFIIK